MTYEEAVVMLDKDFDDLHAKKSNWFNGCLLMKKYNLSYGSGDCDIRGEHDIVYFDEFRENMSIVDVRQMALFGFFLEDECWAKNT